LLEIRRVKRVGNGKNGITFQTLNWFMLLLCYKLIKLCFLAKLLLGNGRNPFDYAPGHFVEIKKLDLSFNTQPYLLQWPFLLKFINIKTLSRETSGKKKK
jgi:hypothetical protein